MKIPAFTLLFMFILFSCQKEEVLRVVTLVDGTRINMQPTDFATPIGWEKESYYQGISELPDITNEDDALTDFKGQENTLAIINQMGEGRYAAKICDELITAGYDDWYLPALGELRAVLGQINSLGEFTNYWSSTEFDDSYAWALSKAHFPLSYEIYFNQDYYNKINAGQYCLCVRRE